MRPSTLSSLMRAGGHPRSQSRCGGQSSSHHRAGLFVFRTLPVFDARAFFIAFSAALILASRSTSAAGKFKAKFSRASARFKRSAFLVSEIGWPIKLSYRKTTPNEAALESPDNPSNTDVFIPVGWRAWVFCIADLYKGSFAELRRLNR